MAPSWEGVPPSLLPCLRCQPTSPPRSCKQSLCACPRLQRADNQSVLPRVTDLQLGTAGAEIVAAGSQP